MPTSKKILSNSEQSMLLMAMLFARKQLDQILSFFPSEQENRLQAAKKRFLQLEQSERISLIILELRRMLLADDFKIDWIHESWIKAQLDLEPAYLRPILLAELESHKQPGFTHEQGLEIRADQVEQNPTNCTDGADFPRVILWQSFIKHFIRTPPKTAIFDPILMQLQAQKNSPNENLMEKLGIYCLRTLALSLDQERWSKFLTRRHPKFVPVLIFVAQSDSTSGDNNQLESAQLKSALIKWLIRAERGSDLPLEAGFFLLALYLSSHNIRWQQAIILGLPKILGEKISLALVMIKNQEIAFDLLSQEQLARLIKSAWEL